jgi:hypothetical protein
VVERLTARGLPVRIGSRSGEPRFDWEDRSIWAAAAEQDVPSEVVEMLTFIFGEVLDGRNVRLADGVQRALGREPRDFSDYARDAAATGIWNATATRAA